ncbi:phosphonate ABC transporter, permease protein PhnE [Rhodobacter sp. KR11]|uniref:phosphonate ABC transporter, permease protein PhnE n=1 Tax=Rhodobacter sp. KR11 TaxID=2974588 RepID=UPI0022239069|nr:phosphonate ABC transporter, permease protein PhnE [Rhodobacter sp. KR11]MCW1920348.1 phosphonate ABC transporter, permease protein PhnE [Rhodobacter sp. KR11]
MDATLTQFRRRARISLALPALVLVYLFYAGWAFQLGDLAAKMRWDNAQILLGDFVSYKVHVIRDNRSGAITANIDGDARDAFATLPDWAGQVVDLGQGHVVTYLPDGARFDVPGYGTLTVMQGPEGLSVSGPQGALPDWVSASPAKVTIVTKAGRLNYIKARAEVWRYFPGWASFFFTLDTPWASKSWGQLAALAITEPRLDPAVSNLAAMADAFWHNRLWHHAEVFAAMGETVLMAFLGTVTAGIISLPLSFMAARNLMPFAPLRFALRRLFDFIRGTDALIWTLLLLRAFGPGPMTGALALVMTDTGAFGKLFSEALENIDGKQVEGIRSTGASPMQRARFGVLPQILPVFLSQLLYALESNTRSATLVGALVGGGIGLLLTQAIQTQKDWEDVAYYLLLIVLTVMAMDAVSGFLRRKLIRGE